MVVDCLFSQFYISIHCVYIVWCIWLTRLWCDVLCSALEPGTCYCSVCSVLEYDIFARMDCMYVQQVSGYKITKVCWLPTINYLVLHCITHHHSSLSLFIDLVEVSLLISRISMWHPEILPIEASSAYIVPGTIQLL